MGSAFWHVIKASLDYFCWSLICFPKSSLPSISTLWKRKGKHASKDWWEKITDVNRKKETFPLRTQCIYMQWSFYVPAFYPKNRKKNRKQISNQDVCLKCGHPIQVPHGRDSGLNLPPPSHASRVHQQFTDRHSSLAESYSGLNNLPQKVAVKHLNTLAYKQSSPTNPERGTWWPPAFLNSFHWKQGWDQLLCHNLLEYHRVGLVPKPT